jgi:hypothetical protein
LGNQQTVFPSGFLMNSAQKNEELQLMFLQYVEGSNPSGLTTIIQDHEANRKKNSLSGAIHILFKLILSWIKPK